MSAPTIPPGTDVEVVGESNYQKALIKISGGRTKSGPINSKFTATLIREPDNPHDQNAVRVDIESKTVGYIPRDTARKFHQLIDDLELHGKSATCTARLTGGWDKGLFDKGSIGVVLSINPKSIKNKTLITCPSCNNDVSRKAPSCPQCGHPIKKQKRPIGCGGCVLIFLVLGAIASAMTSTSTPTNPKLRAPTPIPVKIIPIDERVDDRIIKSEPWKPGDPIAPPEAPE